MTIENNTPIKKIKKKRNPLQQFKNDCNFILTRYDSLDSLFSNLDKLLEYSLKDSSLSKIGLYKQLEVFDSEELSRIIIFCLDGFSSIVEFLEKIKIETKLLDNLRFIVSKYGPRYNQILECNMNEFGWNNIRNNIVQFGDDHYLLELKVYLNNNTTITVRDDAESMLQLASNIINGVSRINKLVPINKEAILELSNGVNKLLGEIE